MRILGYAREGLANMSGTSYYRTYLPMREIHKHDNGINAQCIGADALKICPEDVLEGRDIYYMNRLYTLDGLTQFLDRIHDMGAVVVFDADDDLTEHYRLVSGRGREFKEVLSMVDYVTCSTEPLATLFSEYTKVPATALRNFVDSEWMTDQAGKAKRMVKGITMGFSGSPTHYIDWYIPSVPFQWICQKYPVTGVLHGEVPRYLKYAQEDILEFSGVPFSMYPTILSQFDILLCAVNTSDQFNDGKSWVKALEAMAVGAVPICSRFTPYMQLAAMGAPVVIVEEESRDGWFDAMDSLLADPDRLSALKAAGPGWVRANADMVHGGYLEWEAYFRSIHGS